MKQQSAELQVADLELECHWLRQEYKRFVKGVNGAIKAAILRPDRLTGDLQIVSDAAIARLRLHDRAIASTVRRKQ